jgi:hypothetical protein
LKIKNPSQVPKVMFTVIDENMPNAKADIEQDVNQNLNLPDFFKTRGYDFKEHHHRHGRHHH